MIQQNRAKKNIRRRLFFFITASVFPLLADDVVQPIVNNIHHGKNGVTDIVVDDHADDMTHRSSLSLPQHQIDGLNDDCAVVDRTRNGCLREMHVDNTFFTPADRNDREFIIKYRLFKDKNQQWIEEVLLPLTQKYNGTGSIGVPFYPFDDTGDDIRSQTYRCSTVTSSNSSNDKLSMKKNSTNNQKDFDDDKGVESASNNASSMTVDDGTTTKNKTIDVNPSKTINKKMDVVEVDYASKSAGAIVLDASKDFQGTSNLLQSDRDKYAIVPCNNNNNNYNNHEDSSKNSIKYVVIGLSEDILVKQITIANYERYSSHMKEIQLYGSATTSAIRDAKHWVHLGNYIIASSTSTYGKHTFDLTNPTWARYLKIEFLSHYGNEYYCTVSQISVHGSTVLQGFHEQWNEDNDEDHLDTIVDDSESHRPSKDDSNEFEMKQYTTNTEESRHTNSDTSNNLKVKEIDDNDGADEIPSSLKQGGKSQMQRIEEKTPNMTHRYNFSRIGCHNSRSFEENLNLHSSSNMSGSLGDKTSSLSRISFRSHSFTKCCGSKSIVIPKKNAIGRVKVRHASYHHHDISTPADLTTKTGIDNMRTIKATSASLKDRHLSTLFTSMERVTDFLRSALGAFDVRTNQTSKADNATHRQLNETCADNVNNEQPVDEMKISSEMLPTSATVEETIPADDDTNVNDVKRAINSEVEMLDETNSMIANILQRLPSAKCLESLNFVTYKAVNQKSTSSSKTRNGSNGSINAYSGNGASSGGGGTNPGGGMEPIFKKLTDEIKALQSNVAIHDQYASASIACYQQVLFEMLFEMESDRRIYNERITKLEDKLHSASFLQSCQRFLMWVFMSSIRCDSCSRNTPFVAFMLLLCGAGFLMILHQKRRNARSIFSVSSTSPTVEQPYDINVTKSDTISFQYANHVVSEDDDDSLAEIISITPIVQTVPQSLNQQHQEDMVSPE